MGSLCSKAAQTTNTTTKETKETKEKNEIKDESILPEQTRITTNLIGEEEEITKIEYKSKADEFYTFQENKYNYFKKLQFHDFLYSLVEFSAENSTLEDDYSKANLDYSMNDQFFSEIFSTDSFQLFLEKILKHKSIVEEALENEQEVIIFKEAFLNANNGLGLKLSQNEQSKGNEEVDKNKIIKKGNALAYGILYCGGPNILKIKALFNIFKEEDKIKTSDKFSEFLLSLFIISSYGMASARNKISKFEEVGKIEKETLKKLLDSSELKDSQNLVNVTNGLIFGPDLSNSLSYEQFKQLFEENNKNKSLFFLLSPSGVRYMLENNNI